MVNYLLREFLNVITYLSPKHFSICKTTSQLFSLVLLEKKNQKNIVFSFLMCSSCVLWCWHSDNSVTVYNNLSHFCPRKIFLRRVLCVVNFCCLSLNLPLKHTISKKAKENRMHSLQLKVQKLSSPRRSLHTYFPEKTTFQWKIWKTYFFSILQHFVVV